MKYDASHQLVQTSEKDSDWYQYTNKKWAMAVLKSDISDNGKVKTGAIVYVWVPRFAYFGKTVEFIYGKLVGDKGYIGRNLFERLFVDGIQLITKLKRNMKGALISLSDKLLLRKRVIIETVNDELKNIAQVEHSRHRSFDNFIVNLLGAIAAYCCFPKKPCINVTRTLDTQLALF